MRVLSDGRVRRSESEWREIIERFESSGLSEAAFCRRSKLSRTRFREWQRRLTSKPTTTRRKRAVRREPKSNAPGFVEWAPPSSTAAVSSGAGVSFELELPGGVIVRWKA